MFLMRNALFRSLQLYTEAEYGVVFARPLTILPNRIVDDKSKLSDSGKGFFQIIFET